MASMLLTYSASSIERPAQDRDLDAYLKFESAQRLLVRCLRYSVHKFQSLTITKSPRIRFDLLTVGMHV